MLTIVEGRPLGPELIIGMFGLLLLGVGALWLLVKWLFRGAPAPDPWGPEIAEELNKDDSVALCHRCLCPHGPLANFCTECGAPVGDYTNLLPFPYLFSIGHTLRIGTSGEYRRTRLNTLGFFLLGLAEYTLFAPVYWFMIIRARASTGLPPALGLEHPSKD